MIIRSPHVGALSVLEFSEDSKFVLEVSTDADGG